MSCSSGSWWTWTTTWSSTSPTKTPSSCPSTPAQTRCVWLCQRSECSSVFIHHHGPSSSSSSSHGQTDAISGECLGYVWEKLWILWAVLHDISVFKSRPRSRRPTCCSVGLQEGFLMNPAWIDVFLRYKGHNTKSLRLERLRWRQRSIHPVVSQEEQSSVPSGVIGLAAGAAARLLCGLCPFLLLLCPVVVEAFQWRGHGHTLLEQIYLKVIAHRFLLYDILQRTFSNLYWLSIFLITGHSFPLFCFFHSL